MDSMNDSKVMSKYLYNITIPYSEFMYGTCEVRVEANSREEALEEARCHNFEVMEFHWDNSEPLEYNFKGIEVEEILCQSCNSKIYDECDCHEEGLSDPETTTPDEMYG